MKNILITGGAGKIGFNLLEKLINSNYNITVLDLESKSSIKKMKAIKDKVRIVYGDIEDENLIQDLVKRNDIVINYAGIMPPLANLNESIADSTNYKGVKNIVDAIKELNPSCMFIYMSFISVYGTTDNKKRILATTTESTHPSDAYSVSIIRSEEYIKSNLKKYTIFRMPIVITDKNYFIKHVKLNRTIDIISCDDLNSILIESLESNKIKGKTFNVSGLRVKTNKLIRDIYQATGLISICNRDLYYGEYDDGDAIEELIDIKYTDYKSIIESLKNGISPLKRTIKKILNFIKYIMLKKTLKEDSK